MPTLVLPQQIVPVGERQAALTERHFSGMGDGLMDYFLALRGEIDAALAPRLPPASAGKLYPYGRCEEITGAVNARLGERLRTPSHPVERALAAFLADGGVARTVWGVLRDQYFQNAFQFGGLYVDVSNDTVVVTKPKVEILPISQSGLVPVRGVDHFRQAAERYWGATIYANHLTPSLAPILPMLSASPGRLAPGLQSACDYMIALMSRDGFFQAEDWLRDGPPPPPDVAQEILATIPPDLRPQTGNGRVEAIAACQSAREAGAHHDPAWRDARVRDYLRIARR